MTETKINLKEVLSTAQEIRITYMKNLVDKLKNSINKFNKRFSFIKNNVMKGYR